MRRKKGRPTKLTPELIEHLKLFAQIGMTWRDLAAYIGVGLSTVNYWRKIGEKEKERRTRGKTPIQKFDIYCDFLEATLKARLQTKYACVQLIYGVAMGGQKQVEEGMTKPNWQAAAWLLERLYPDEFALASRMKLAELAEQVKQMKKEAGG